MITPGQYGFDLWASEVIIELRDQRYPDLKLSMITAFMNQEEKWKDNRKQYYEHIKSQVDFFTEVSKQPYVGPWQFQARDQLLFYKTNGIILFYDDDAAPSNMKYVKQRAIEKQQKEPYEIISIVAEDIQDSMEQEQYFDDFA